MRRWLRATLLSFVHFAPLSISLSLLSFNCLGSSAPLCCSMAHPLATMLHPSWCPFLHSSTKTHSSSIILYSHLFLPHSLFLTHNLLIFISPFSMFFLFFLWFLSLSLLHFLFLFPSSHTFHLFTLSFISFDFICIPLFFPPSKTHHHVITSLFNLPLISDSVILSSSRSVLQPSLCR